MSIQYGGYTWNRLDDGETWEAKIDDKCYAVTWKFGAIHQAKVFVYHDHMIDGKQHMNPVWEDSVPICLHAEKTRKEAMQRGLDWIKNYKEKGLPTTKETFEYCFKHFHSIYPNRVALLDHLFFTLGSGYRWLDGAIINVSPDSYLDMEYIHEKDKEIQKLVKETQRIFKEMNELKKAAGEEVVENYFTDPDALWTQDVYEFYPVSEQYANICCIPDDIKPDWLALAYEAALLLRDKSGLPKIRTKRATVEEDQKKQDRNKEIGTKVIADLERRFPHVLQKGQ